MTARSSNPAPSPGPEEARLARVAPHVARARRIGAMLERWAEEDVADEPEWSVDDVPPVGLRPPPSPTRT